MNNDKLILTAGKRFALFICVFILCFLITLQVRTIKQSESDILRLKNENELRDEINEWKDLYVTENNIACLKVYTVEDVDNIINYTFKDLNNSHFVRAKFKRVNETVEEVVEENNKLPMIIVLIGVAVFILLTAVVVTILLLRRRREQSKITNGKTIIESGGNGNEGY